MKKIIFLLILFLIVLSNVGFAIGEPCGTNGRCRDECEPYEEGEAIPECGFGLCCEPEDLPPNEIRVIIRGETEGIFSGGTEHLVFNHYGEPFSLAITYPSAGIQTMRIQQNENTLVSQDLSIFPPTADLVEFTITAGDTPITLDVNGEVTTIAAGDTTEIEIPISTSTVVLLTGGDLGAGFVGILFKTAFTFFTSGGNGVDIPEFSTYGIILALVLIVAIALVILLRKRKHRK